MASKIYGAIALTGGSDGAVDTILHSVLSDADMCIAIVGGATDTSYIYTYDSGSSAAESSPSVIKPDDAGASNGRWILTSLHANDLTTIDDLVVGDDLTVSGLAAITGTLSAGATSVASLDINSSTVIDGFLDEDNMASDSATKGATQQSIKSYVDNTLGGASLNYDWMAGFSVRTKAAYNNTTSILLQPFRYHHDGTSEQIVKSDAVITYTFTGLGASQWSYLYLDDSAIVTAGTNVVTATELVDSTTAPTWSNTKLGWYNGNDRCIFAVLTNGSSQILEFLHEDDLVTWADYVESRALADLDTAWVDVTLDAPAFSQKAQVTLWQDNQTNNTSNILYWRTNGQTGSTGHAAIHGKWTNSAGVHKTNTLTVVTDASQIIEITHSLSDATRAAVYTDGWYFPKGF